MQLGGDLRPSNNEELRAARLAAFGKKGAEPAGNQSLIGEDQQGHKIETVDPSLPQKVSLPFSELPVDNAVVATQVSTTPEQAVQDLAQSVEETTQLAKELENLFKAAPTMACLRILDVADLHDETTKFFEANQGAEIANKKIILNNGHNGHPPVRVAVPIPGTSEGWTSVTPSIIPADITVRFPDKYGNWVDVRTPNREPDSAENKQVRDLIQGALRSHYGASEAARMCSSYEGEITVENVSEIMATKPEGNPNHDLVRLITTQKDQKDQEDSLEKARQQLTSPYVPLLEGLSAAAEFVARGAGAVVGTVGIALGKGFVDGSMGGGQFVEKTLDQAPLIISTGPIAAVPVLAGIILGALIGPIRALPQAAKDSFEYFSPQQNWEKSVAALSLRSDTGHTVGLLQKANEADEKIKTDIEMFLQPFEQDAKYQKIKEILIHQIDQKIVERTAVMQQLNRKIKEQKKHVVVTGSRIGKRQFPI